MQPRSAAAISKKYSKGRLQSKIAESVSFCKTENDTFFSTYFQMLDISNNQSVFLIYMLSQCIKSHDQMS